MSRQSRNPESKHIPTHPTLSELLTDAPKTPYAPSDLTDLPPAYLRIADVAPTKEPSTSPLEEALRITTGDRQNSYGHPLEDFSRTAALWTSLLGEKLRSKITPEEVALCMVCLKLSREMNKHKQDNLVDIAGYINCLHMLIEEKKYESEIS
jgi:hypothetical protein